MKRLFIAAILCCICSLSASAQVKYCLSYADYQEDKWNLLDTLFVKESGTARKKWTGADDFRLAVADDSLKKVLKKEAFAVLYHDTLLINCRHIYYHGECFNNGYTLGYNYGNGRLCFINYLIGDDSGGNTYGGLIFGNGLLGGVLGGYVNSKTARSMANMRCYLVKREYEGGRIEVQMIDDEFMSRFKTKSPEFYAEYMSVKKKNKRESAVHVLPLLKDWQLIH